MVNLNDLFANAPTVTLLEPRGDTPYFLKSIRLLINDGGLLRELTVTADLMTSRETFEDEGCLALSLMDVEAPGFSRKHGEWVDDGCVLCGHNGTTIDGDGICWTPIQVERSDEPEPCGCRCALNVTTEIEPRIEWCVTPGGEEIDLRGDGLFG